MSENSYLLRFPFRPLHWVTGLESDYEFNIGNLHCVLIADKPYLVIKVQPFSKEQEALAFIPRLWGALAWISVELRTGFVVETQVDAVTYSKDPDQAAINLEKSLGLPNRGPVHGLVSGQMPSAIPVGKNIRVIKVGEATATICYSADKYAPVLARAISQANIETLSTDEKLRTAIELLSDAQREISIRSKFLTHVIALEVLSDPTTKHSVAQELLDDLNLRIEDRLNMCSVNSDEHHTLESLQRELIFRGEASLRSSVRRLILEGLSDLPKDELSARSREVVWAYDLRGSLVHDGTVPIPDLNRAHNIVYQALLDLLARKIGVYQSI